MLGQQPGKGEMRGLAIENQIGMHFIGADVEVVALTEIRQLLQLHTAEQPANRVVRMAQQQQARRRLNGRCTHRLLQCLEVDGKFGAAFVGGFKRNIQRAAALHLGRMQKRRIHRRKGDNALTGRTAGLHSQIETQHQPRQPDNPLRLDGPAIALPIVIRQLLRQFMRHAHVPVITVGHVICQRALYGRRRGKIHVGNPQRNHVAATVLFPFSGGPLQTAFHAGEIKGFGHGYSGKTVLQVSPENRLLSVGASLLWSGTPAMLCRHPIASKLAPTIIADLTLTSPASPKNDGC